jgi:hypothetical protein
MASFVNGIAVARDPEGERQRIPRDSLPRQVEVLGFSEKRGSNASIEHREQSHVQARRKT